MKTRYHDEHSCEICREKGRCECVTCVSTKKVSLTIPFHDPDCNICDGLKDYGKTNSSLSLPYTFYN